ncbi:FtsW/RodA/SpoVE family cell cycle protein [Tissierella sp. MSJ-40]|uniref:FtsW/RodA/SpoVE family cell cycle protein n=1 Tax=Tissierella simiarum TaxID=2841534 RepID=A0ABS6E887_9FIRM|nr:FtsW/RodA/SpoVE family cell cycle protein [Tissierella simiarum]MBU5439046.1 FtsW/RodA/SpoVE family cell cycle protein [Tissierella simiarum]
MDLMKNKKVNAYIDVVCSQIKFKDVHMNIKEELMDHINNNVIENIDKGISLEESIDMGIKQMGDPYDLGRQLNKVHKPKPEWGILALTFIFISIGIFAIYAINKNGLLDSYGSYNFMKQSIKMSIIGTGIIISLYFFDYRKMKSFSKYLYIATSILLYFNRDRIAIFNITTDLAYLTPFSYALALSGIFSRNRWNKKNIISNLVILFLPIILIIGFQSQAVASSIIMYFIMVSVLIIISSGNLKYILGSIGCGTAIGSFLISKNLYRVNRLTIFLNPLEVGYMNTLIRKLISSAGLYGNNTQIVIPDAHTDLILPYIIYAFGWLAGIFIIALSIIFFIRLIKTTKNIKDNYGKLLMATFSSLFIIQFAYNIFMIFGLVPLIGLSMPFISYGTTLNIVNMIMIGIISSVYRRKNLSIN